MRVVLDLCSGTGSWSEPYRAAGYIVIRWDLPNDIRLMPKPDVPIHGILAGPPCTVFAASGNRWQRTDREILDGLSVADACLRFVSLCRPAWWALENPVGKLQRWLGPPQFVFDPCDYGDPYTKKTCLWGDFIRPEYHYVKPTEGSKMWKQYGGKSAKTKRERSRTPAGFAKAFFEANP